MKKFTDTEKETIYDRLANKGESPFTVAGELGIGLPDLLDITVEVLTKKQGKSFDNPQKSLNDGDDMVESTKPPKKEKDTKKADSNAKKTDKLSLNVTYGVLSASKVTPKAPKQEAVKESVETKLDTNQTKPASNFVKPMVISVDRLGALAYRLSKLHMSEDTIVKVLNIVLEVPEPTIREALA